MPKRGSRLRLVQPPTTEPPPPSFEFKVASAAAASAAVAYALDQYAGPFQIFDWWNLPTDLQLALCTLFGSVRRQRHGTPPPAA
jgi:hypothetical protein